MSRAAPSGPAVPVTHAHTAGPMAAAVLRDKAPLAVTAVFEKSFYCRDDRDRWLCFLRDDLESGPLHVLCANWPADLNRRILEGQTLAPDGDGVMAAPALAIDCTMFREWRPPVFPPPNPSALRRALPRLRDAMRMAAPKDTVADLALNGRPPDDGWRRAAAEKAIQALDTLSRWLASAQEPLLRDAVRALVGLGPGLTPTGDDILAGTLLTLHALGRKTEAGKMAVALKPHASEGTNPISLAHLRTAASGLGAAPFHDMLNELLLGGESLDQCLRRIDAIGHSSGWDILTGILTTMECHASQRGNSAHGAENDQTAPLM